MSTTVGLFGRNGEILLQATIPGGPNPTIDPNEPAKLPCTSPPQCAELDAMIARNRWSEWNCAVYRLNGSGQKVIYANYNREHLNAWNAHMAQAHPPPGCYVPGF